MKVLIACEESQTVCKAFRKRGHEAYSCDIDRGIFGYDDVTHWMPLPEPPEED